MQKFLLGILLLAICAPGVASAADGYFDPTWAGGGRIAFAGDFHNQQRNSFVSRIIVDANGRLLLVGAGTQDWWLGQLNANGTPVATFGESNGSGVVTGCWLSAALCGSPGIVSATLMDDGRIVVLDWMRLVRVAAAAHALDTAGVIGGTGVVQANWQLNDVQGKIFPAHSIVLLPSGKLLVAGEGNYSAAATQTDFALARLQSNFDLDGSFNAGMDGNGVTFAGGNIASAGAGVYSYALNAFVENDGRIVLIGYGTGGRFAMRFLTTGARDTSFGVAGVATFDPQGIVLISESATVRDPGGRYLVIHDSLYRLGAEGVPDSSFGVNGSATVSPPAALCSTIQWFNAAFDSAGRIVLAGSCSLSGSPDKFIVARLFGDNGALDTSFGINGFSYGAFSSGSLNDSAGVIAFDRSGRPIVGGHSQSGFNSVYQAAVARLTYDLIFTNDLEAVPRGRLPGQ